MTHFGFALDLSDIDLWNIDLLDTHLDLLGTDITSKQFVCLGDVLKMSSRYVFRMSSRHVLKTSWRRLQRNNFSSSKASWRRLARGLESVLEDVKLLRRRCFEDVFKMSWRPANVCWVIVKCLLKSNMARVFLLTFTYLLTYLCNYLFTTLLTS